MRIGIVTVSDRASRGEYEDRAGPAIRAFLERALVDGKWEAVERLVPDETVDIVRTLVDLSDREGCGLIWTSGGTGPAPRDVTPEATRAVVEKVLPGFGEAMRESFRATIPTAMLARQVAGVRGRTLIVNLPGNPKAIAECMDVVLPAVPHALSLIGAGELHTRSGHLIEHE